jgi:hypothetical protein
MAELHQMAIGNTTQTAKAPNYARCEFHQKARAACQEKVGPEHKACLRAQFSVK